MVEDYDSYGKYTLNRYGAGIFHLFQFSISVHLLVSSKNIDLALDLIHHPFVGFYRLRPVPESMYGTTVILAIKGNINFKSFVLYDIYCRMEIIIAEIKLDLL
jgi:hypothetical protein